MSEMDLETVSEMLYEDRMVNVAAADNQWTRASRVELTDLVDENWTLPEPEHPVTSIVASAFRAIGCEAPRVTATAPPGRIRDTLLATGRFLTVVQESALHFGATLPQLKVLPVELAMARGTMTSIMTLKKRALSPAARLFIENLREAAEPLAKRKRNSAPSQEQNPTPRRRARVAFGMPVCSRAAVVGQPVRVRFGSKADIAAPPRNVRFAPESGHQQSALGCPLCANSGLSRRNSNLFDYLVGGRK
jgi:hypothetical protein